MEEHEPRPPADSTDPAAYEPPCVESVLTPEELERQAHYAGGVGGSLAAG